MKQDDVYKKIEADQFFERNAYDFNILPEKKKSLIDYHFKVLNTGTNNAVLEIGCHIGDLLHYAGEKFGSSRRVGIEPSKKAVEHGKKIFHKNHYITGVIADKLEIDFKPVDLIIINDVFCWISRETLFLSLTNIDKVLKIGGKILLRDFLPNGFVANRNKHVTDHQVFCYKVIGSHGQIFVDSGKYKLLSSRVFMGDELSLSKETYSDDLEDRWVDMLLLKIS